MTLLPIDGPSKGVGDSAELLLEYLDWYRTAVFRKIAGLSDEQLRTPVPPLNWTPLGMIKHLGWVERRWARWGFAAEDVVAEPPGGDATEFTVSAGETTTSVLAEYRYETAQARRLTAEAKLTDHAAPGGRFRTAEEAPTLASILFHLLQEYTRHTGHLDIARELIDGATGE